MNPKKLAFLAVTHISIGFAGFILGVFSLPLLTAPPSPTNEALAQVSSDAMFTTRFVKNLKDSDFLHWGEGDVYLSDNQIALDGRLAPGPNYMLYLSPEFVETEDDFRLLKHRMVNVGDVNTFDNFIVSVPDDIDLQQYNSVIVWCEAFGQFITAAKYQ